jgi:ribosomal protein S6--L-glutamate ligase
MRVAYFPKDDAEATLFAQEFAAQGADCELLHPPDVWLACTNNITTGAGPELTLQDLNSTDHKDIPFSDFDLVFQRSVSSWNQTFGAEIVQFFFEVLYLTENTTPVVNPVLATIAARRKHLAAALLSRHGIPVPPYFASPNPIRNMRITGITPPPTIVKTLEGAAGIGVLLAPNAQVLGDVISLFYKNQHVPLLQTYVPTPHDLRVFVLDDQVIGAIRRQGAIHKHNIALGATATYVPPIRLPPDITEHALAATQHLNLNIAGVDFLTPHQGPLLLEVNPSPGFQALARASQTNIQQHIVAYLLKRAKS